MSPEKWPEIIDDLSLNSHSIIMEYQKIINLLESNQINEVSWNKKLGWRKSWVEVNCESRGTYTLIIKINLKLQC